MVVRPQQWPQPECLLVFWVHSVRSVVESVIWMASWVAYPLAVMHVCLLALVPVAALLVVVLALGQIG